MASRILHEFTIDKIAAVDRPCQEHATVAIMKRDNSDELRKREIAQRLLKLKLDVLGTQVEKAWSDEARQASIEARRAHTKAKEHESKSRKMDSIGAVQTGGRHKTVHDHYIRAHYRFKQAAEKFRAGDRAGGAAHMKMGSSHLERAASARKKFFNK